jgi:hypothetical protein
VRSRAAHLASLRAGAAAIYAGLLEVQAHLEEFSQLLCQ